MTEADDSVAHFNWDEKLVVAITDALSEPAEPHVLSQRVQESFDALTASDTSYSIPSHARSLREGLDYHASRPDGQKSSADDLYVPMIGMSDGTSYPHSLSTVSIETTNAWTDLVKIIPANPVALGRLHDLLWVVKAKPRPDLHARAAFTALSEQWGISGVHAVNQADALIRALEIASELRNDRTLLGSIIPKLVSAIRDTLQSQDWAPGVALPMLESVAGVPDDLQPPELGALIAECLEKYSSDPFITESILLLKMRRASPPERAEIALQAVQMWQEQAEALGGIVGMAHLERAYELATTEGLSAAAQEIRLLLQEPRTPEELGMQRISAEVTIPAEDVDRFVDAFVSTSGVEENIYRLAAYSPIRDVDEDIEAVREQMRMYPIQYLATGTVTNSDGLPLAHLTNDEQHFSNALTRHHSLGITLWGSMLARMFGRLQDEGRVAPEQLEQHLRGDFTDEHTASGVAKAWSHIHSGDYEAALHYLLTRIERSLRNVARTLGLPIYRPPSLDGKQMGAYRGLGDLLRLLEGHLPEPTRRYFAVLLTERTGVNLRNRSAHGLMTHVSMEEAALAMHVLMVISTWGITPSDDDDGPPTN